MLDSRFRGNDNGLPHLAKVLQKSKILHHEKEYFFLLRDGIAVEV